jgi:hypothetical protein
MVRGRRRGGARRAWGGGQGHGQSRYGLRRQAKRDAAFPESIWPGCKHLRRFQPKRRRASLAAAVHIGCHARQDTNSRSGPQAGTWLVPVSCVSRACLVPLSYKGGPRLRGKGRSPPRTGVRRRCRWLVRPPGYATAFSTRNRLKRLQRCSLARAGSQKDRALGA